MNGANNNGVAQACKVRKGLDVSFAARLFNLLLFMAFIAALLRSGSRPATYLHHHALCWCRLWWFSAGEGNVTTDANIIFSYFSVD
ncbi:hypothetical protein [Serratia quinivorans]|uniref:hypothetical protein n=2 Tax=Serratia TaxID=613 RepID=UPI00107EA868|nr:hypothetical protein [Serratia quinivorans]QBX64720.1 hypothetical protein E4343_00365 [Serratia quinivorans]